MEKERVIGKEREIGREKEKGGGKKSLNMATESEYYAAWYGDGGIGNDDIGEYGYYNDGYNYTLTN